MIIYMYGEKGKGEGEGGEKKETSADCSLGKRLGAVELQS